MSFRSEHIRLQTQENLHAEQAFLDKKQVLRVFVQEVDQIPARVEVFVIEQRAADFTFYAYFVEVVVNRGSNGTLVSQSMISPQVGGNHDLLAKTVAKNVSGLLNLHEAEKNRLFAERQKQFFASNGKKIRASLFGRGVNVAALQAYLQEFEVAHVWDESLKSRIAAIRNTLPAAINRYFGMEFQRCNQVLDRYYQQSSELIRQNKALSAEEKDMFWRELPFGEVYRTHTSIADLQEQFAVLKKRAYNRSYKICLERLEKEGRFSSHVGNFLRTFENVR